MGANTVGEIIGGLQQALGLPNDEYAALYGVRPEEVSRWSRGEASPPEEVLSTLEGASLPLDLIQRAVSELSTVRSLVDAVDVETKRLRERGPLVAVLPTWGDRVRDETELEIMKYQVLRQQAWGRLVRVLDVDHEVECVFRIAWGEASWTRLDVFSRNAPVIKQLMSARVGDTVECATPGGARTFEVLEVALLQRHTDAALSGNFDNFARADLRLDAKGQPALRIDDLRAWVKGIRERISEGIEARSLTEPVVDVPPEEETLQEDSRSSLSDRFFMDPLEAQEEIMRFSTSGFLLVEGVAGSGKTSVALGRSAFLCMGDADEGSAARFRPESGIGFVLSDQLVSYLSGLLRGNLNLEKMPVQSYFSLRQGLLGVRNLLTRGVRRVDAESGAQDPVVGSAAWAAAVEELIAARILAEIQRTLPTEPSALLPSSTVPLFHWEAITRYRPWNAKEETTPAQDLWEKFCKDFPHAFGVRASRDLPTLDGTLERLEALRASFSERLEVLPPWNSPKWREERRKVSNAIRAIVEGAFAYTARYFEVFADPGFEACLDRHLAASASALDRSAVAEATRAARARATAKALSNADIDALLLAAHHAAAGYTGREGALPIAKLAQQPYRSHVFIDEVQDFSEVQVRLMAAQANPEHHSVTAVGDFSQRLAKGGLGSAEGSGLVRSGQSLFLAWNKRQSAPLNAFASAFRRAVQGDHRPCTGEPPGARDERPFLLGVGVDATLQALRDRLLETRERFSNASIAVLCPSVQRATTLEASLHDEMWALNILTRASHSQVDAARLCERFYVHFTTPLQAKGLEFDAVFAVDIDAYDLADPTQQGALYVTLTRACRRLGVGLLDAPRGPLADLLAAHVTSVSL